MKNLIQQLAEQAKKSVPQGLAVDKWIEVYNEKFAELIVRECAVIADQEGPNYVGCGYITKTKGMRIKEHFGVEE